MRTHSYKTRIFCAAVALSAVPVLTGADDRGCTPGGDIRIGWRPVDGGAGGSTETGPSSCSERTQAAQDRISRASVDTSCRTDADCTFANNTSECSHSCGAILSMSGARALADEIAKVNAEVCADFDEDGCKAFIPPCEPPDLPVCSRGTCVGAREAVGGSTGGEGGTSSEQTCSDRTRTAQERIAAKIEWAQDHLQCNSDADCTLVNNNSACSFGCGVVLSSTGASALRSEIQSVNNQVCGNFTQDGCQAVISPCPPPQEAACSNGTCVGSFPGAGGGGGMGTGGSMGTGGAALSCNDRTQTAQRRVAQAIDIADNDLSCRMDADCVIANNSTHCSGSCGVMLSTTGATLLRAEIDKVNAEVCGDVERDGCMAVYPPCPLPPPAACVNSMCQHFPPAAWSTFFVQQSSSPGLSTPPSCSSSEGCSLWKLTADGRLTTTKQGTQTVSSLTAADFSTVDGILRSVSFRQSELTGFQCDPPPTGPTTSFHVENSYSMSSYDVSGCISSNGTDAQRLFDVIRRY